MRGKNLLWVILLLGVLVVAPVGAELWVLHRLERCIKFEIHGKFVPALFSTTFYIRDAQFEWKNRVELISGNLKVQYDPTFFLGNKILRVRFSSRALQVKLLGTWSAIEGVENVILESFEADLGFDKEGMREIYMVDAYSPAFQFRIKKSENLRTARSSREEKIS